jgi:hypothetical protein
MKTIAITQFLTEAQIRLARRLYVKSKGQGDAVAQIHAQVIEPNLAAINEKIGQENDARYLAYAVVDVFNQLADPQRVCRACDGDGILMADASTSPDERVTRDSRRCTYCGGKGWVPRDN